MTATAKPEKLRTERVRKLKRLGNAVTKAEQALEDAIAERDWSMIEFHGERLTGGLSYREMAAATGIGRGRVIQIVQGRSNYSRSLTRTDDA